MVSVQVVGVCPPSHPCFSVEQTDLDWDRSRPFRDHLIVGMGLPSARQKNEIFLPNSTTESCGLDVIRAESERENNVKLSVNHLRDEVEGGN